MTKKEIIAASEKIFSSFTTYCMDLEDTTFFHKPGPKWSVAENVQHLVVSINTSTLAFSLPLFIVQLISGTSNRESKTYQALVDKYKAKLAAGGAASGRFVPRATSIKISKEQLLLRWKKAIEKYLAALLNNRTETELDKYLVKHPLLGKITLRELCYFTIYHTEHHLNSIHSVSLCKE